MLAGIGLLMLCFPEAVYTLTESWKSCSGGESSKLYRISARIGGACFLVVGIMAIVANITA
ncbi:MAG: hypothetical protein E7420_00400 [Ruminococcaceae bacterium]|nr:hypothetical protein [Oscillospiraceae bacterium]